MRLRARPPLPDPDLVELLVHGVGVLRARVRTAYSGVADLDLVPAAPAGFLDGREATLVPIAGAPVEGVLETGWAPGHVRFSSAGARSRRLFSRIRVERDALLLPDRVASVWRARTLDLGAGGALLTDLADLPLGARLELRLQLDPDAADDILRTRVRVIRAGGALRAVHFEDLTPDERRRLMRFVERHRDE